MPLKLLSEVNALIFRADKNKCYFLGLKRLSSNSAFTWLDGKTFKGFTNLIDFNAEDFDEIGKNCVCIFEKPIFFKLQTKVVSCHANQRVICHQRDNCNRLSLYYDASTHQHTKLNIYEISTLIILFY